MSIPLVILGGRDRRGTVLPEEAHDKVSLRGYKGADLRIGDRPLIEVAIERWRGAGFFEPIYIAGPLAVYGPLGLDARIVDTDGELVENLRAARDEVAKTYQGKLAVTTCDILPDPAELALAIADYRAHEPLDFFMPLARVPADTRLLGASDWKPKYWIKPALGKDPVPILPSHLMIGDPDELRLRFIYQFFDHLYRTRNRSVTYRRVAITRKVLGTLLTEDLQHLLHLRLPHITATVVFNALWLASRLAAGQATIKAFEQRLRYVFLRRDVRRAYPRRRGRVPILDCLSLAKDIDTVEEAREVAAAAAAAPDHGEAATHKKSP